MSDVTSSGPIIYGDDAGMASPSSPLDDLQAELAAPRPDKVKVLPLEFRPGWSVKYSTDIPYEKVRQWSQQATVKVKGQPKKIDPLRMAVVSLIDQCLEVRKDGETVFDTFGEPVTFESGWLMEGTKTDNSYAAVRALYDSDGQIGSHADTLMREAGYGDDFDPSDPTLAE